MACSTSGIVSSRGGERLALAERNQSEHRVAIGGEAVASSGFDVADDALVVDTLAVSSGRHA
jgi:hypothetical protein